jgi:hypothetical protein
MQQPTAARRVSNRQSGAVFVEASIALPFLLGILCITMLLLFFCFRILSFQHALAEVTRETFSRDSDARAGQTWQQYWETQLNSRTASLNLVPQSSGLTSAQISFTNETCGSGWECSASAEPGDIFSVSLTLTVPVFPQSLGGLSLPEIQFSSRSIAAIQMRESE